MTAETSNARGEWVLVPRVPTEAMLDAMHSRIRILCDPAECTAAIQNDREVWAAMLAAAPPPPADAEVWVFKGTDGAWRTFHNEQHRLDTIADGRWDVRKFYDLPPPAAARGDVPYDRELIAQMLDAAEAPAFTMEEMDTQARLLREAAQAKPEARGVVDGCHCATCTCAPGMTPAVRFDTSPAAKEGAVRDHLIALGWTPPNTAQPTQQGGGEVNMDVTVRDGTWVGTYAEWCRRKQIPPPSATVGVEWDMPCGECSCGVYDTRAFAAFDGTFPKCKRFDRYCVGAIHCAQALAQQPAAVDRARFRKAPCYLCGYNGPGYFQPETHPCAALYHAAQHQEPKS